MAGKKKLSLVIGHLERISSKVFSDYPKQITDLVGRQHGVYALYKGDHLYYVGLASNLRNRIKNHLKDKHAGKWDKFSLYLVRETEHIKEIESILIRIADPAGNSKGGRLIGADNLKSQLEDSIKKDQEMQLNKLLGHKSSLNLHSAKQIQTKGKSGKIVSDAHDLRSGMKLSATYKGTQYSAVVRKSGKIEYNGKLYNSPSMAARAITKRSMNGWYFWRFKHANGEYVRLSTLRNSLATLQRSEKKSQAIQLPAGLKLFSNYKGGEYTATVNKKGQIVVGSEVFNSPSVAGKHAAGHPMNGWFFWKIKDQDGKFVPLDTLRKRKDKKVK
jgi:hypothetical protein